MSRQRLQGGGVLTVVRSLDLARRDVAQGAVQPGVVEPVDPGQRAQLEVVDGADGSSVAHAFGLVQADH